MTTPNCLTCNGSGVVKVLTMPYGRELCPSCKGKITGIKSNQIEPNEASASGPRFEDHLNLQESQLTDDQRTIQHLRVKLAAAEKTIKEFDMIAPADALRAKLHNAMLINQRKENQLIGLRQQVADLKAAVAKLKAIKKELRNIIDSSRRD